MEIVTCIAALLACVCSLAALLRGRNTGGLQGEDLEKVRQDLLAELRQTRKELADAQSRAAQTQDSHLREGLQHLAQQQNAGVSGEIKANQLTRAMRAEIGFALKHLTFNITGTRPIEEAIVTSGGVSVREIDPKTMRSKLCVNLYFAGEVMDVDAYTGGFNLQIAFSTGYCAGCSVE